MFSRWFVAAALLSGSLLTAGPATADSLRVVAMGENGCREVALNRLPVDAQKMRQLVPDRYGLLPGGPPGSARTLLNVYTCAEMSVDGTPTSANGARPTIVSIWSALINSRDGASLSGAYVLSYATDNPVLFAHLQRSGLPVSFQPFSQATETTVGTTTTMTFAMRGAVDYDLTSTASEPNGAPVQSTAWYYQDTPSGPVALVFDNAAAAPTPATVTADFRRFEPYASMTVASLTPTNVPGFYIRGSWHSAIEPAE